MNGGNISDGRKGRSGNVIDIKGALQGKKAPPEVNEARPAIRPVEQQLEDLKKRYDSDLKKWLRDTNHLSDKLRHVRAASQNAIDGMRAMYEKQTEELINTRCKFDKYLNLNMAQEEAIEKLEAEVTRLREEAACV